MKKLMALLLAGIMLITALPISAADFESPEIPPEGHGVWINPAYAYLPQPAISEEPGESLTTSAVPTVLKDFDSIVEYIREAMKNRVVRIEFSTTYVSIGSTFAEKTKFDAFLRDYICKHIPGGPNDPKGGDYILAHISGIGYGYTTNGINLSAYLTVVYHDSTEQEAAVDAEVEKILSSLALSGKSDYEKVCAIYDWITHNITYDNEYVSNIGPDVSTLPHSAYAAAVLRKCVCQGYASLFYRLCLEVGVDCRYIGGTADPDGDSDFSNAGPHAWNIVRLGDKYYNVDVTWDTTLAEMGLSYQYFLTSPASFGRDHTRDPEYTDYMFVQRYPMSESAYDPSTTPGGEFPTSEFDLYSLIGVPIDEAVVKLQTLLGDKITEVTSSDFERVIHLKEDVSICLSNNTYSDNVGSIDYTLNLRNSELYPEIGSYAGISCAIGADKIEEALKAKNITFTPVYNESGSMPYKYIYTRNLNGQEISIFYTFDNLYDRNNPEMKLHSLNIIYTPAEWSKKSHDMSGIDNLEILGKSREEVSEFFTHLDSNLVLSKSLSADGYDEISYDYYKRLREVLGLLKFENDVLVASYVNGELPPKNVEGMPSTMSLTELKSAEGVLLKGNPERLFLYSDSMLSVIELSYLDMYTLYKDGKAYLYACSKDENIYLQIPTDRYVVIGVGYAEEPEITYLAGDVDHNGQITLDDAILTLKHAMNVELGDATFIEDAADINDDGKITIDDAISVLRMAMSVE